MSDEQIEHKFNGVTNDPKDFVSRTQRSAAPKSASEIRHRLFVDGLLDGKSMFQAAVDAGYSPVTAKQAGRDIMPHCKSLLRQALHNEISITKLARKVREGLDAKTTKFFADKGIVTDERDVIDWAERRQYADLATKLMDLQPDKAGVNINAQGTFQVAVMYRGNGPNEGE